MVSEGGTVILKRLDQDEAPLTLYCRIGGRSEGVASLDEVATRVVLEEDILTGWLNKCFPP